MGIHDQTRTSHPLPLSAPFPPQKLQLATSQCLAFWHFLRCLEGAWRVWRCPLERRGVSRRIARSSTVRKLSSRLWLTSESLNDEQLEVALAKARKKTRKLKTTKKAKERKRLLNASSHFSLPENETSTNHEEEFLYEQEETNIAKETTESANITEVAINSNFVLTEEEKVEEEVIDTSFILENKTMSPLLLSSCEYIDLTILQNICGPGFAADFSSTSKTLHQTVFFDVGSGHTILGVHSEPRWQCCKQREDRTEGVGCRMGAACPATNPPTAI